MKIVFAASILGPIFSFLLKFFPLIPKAQTLSSLSSLILIPSVSLLSYLLFLHFKALFRSPTCEKKFKVGFAVLFILAIAVALWCTCEVLQWIVEFMIGVSMSFWFSVIDAQEGKKNRKAINKATKKKKTQCKKK